MFIGFAFTTNGFATITGNNSFATAYDMGYWQYHSYDVTLLSSGQNEAYYQFTANAGDRIYARSSYDGYTGMAIQIVDYSNNPLSNLGIMVMDASSFSPFIFTPIDITTTVIII